MTFFVAIAMAVCASSAFGFALTPTPFPLPHSNFQGGDGNQADETINEQNYIDWQGLDQEGLVVNTMDQGTNEANGASTNDDGFQQGSALLAPGQWVVYPGNVGVARNILNVYHTFTRAPNGDAMLYFAATRGGNTGTTWLSFMLNQKEPKPNGLPCLSAGDLLISLDQAGGSTTTVRVQKWETTGMLDSHDCAQTGTLADVPELNDKTIQGAVNRQPIPKYLPGVDSGIVTSSRLPGYPDSMGTIGERGFVEAAINLTQALGLGSEEETCGAGTFYSFWALSRSSDAPNSSLDDFVAPIPIRANPCPVKTVTITKRIRGDGAHDRGDVVIHLRCRLPDGSPTPVQMFLIPRAIRATKVTESFEVPHNSTSCRVTEPVTGANDLVSVRTTFSVNGGREHSHPVSVHFGPNVFEAHFVVTDHYTHRAHSLTIVKTVTGDRRDRSDIELEVTCTPGTTQRFTIPAGERSPITVPVPNVLPHSTCTVTEPVTGENGLVSVDTKFELPTGGTSPSVDNTGPNNERHATVTIEPGQHATVHVKDHYTHNPGRLVIRKLISGSAANHRGDIRINVRCTDGTRRSFLLSASSSATSFTRVVSPIAAHATCTVTEPADGSNAAASVVTTFDPASASGDSSVVRVGPGATVTVTITDDYTHNPGRLVIRKLISGSAANHRGDIRINVRCTDGTRRSFLLSASSSATSFTRVVSPIAAHATCTVTEPADGSNAAASVVTTFDPASASGDSSVVRVGPGATVTVTITDDYTHNPGRLVIRKLISGSAANHRGDIRINVRCTDGTRRSFLLSASSSATSFTGVVSPIAAHATCTVTEPADGSNAQASVVTSPSLPHTVVVGPGATVHLTITDTYEHGEADLSITKTSSVATVRPGDQVTYTLVVTNHGPADANDVTVSDRLNAALTLISAIPSQGSCTGSHDVRCSLGTLPVGGSAMILVTTRVSSSFTGSIENAAVVTSSTPDPDPTNNRDTNTIIVQPQPPQPVEDVGVVKTVDRQAAHVGERLTYTLRITNHGSLSAPDVVVTDTSSEALRIVSVHPSQGSCTQTAPVRCSLGTLAGGGHATVTIIAEALHAGSVRNTAAVTAAINDTNPANDVSTAHTTVRVRPAPPPPKPPPPVVTG